MNRYRNAPGLRGPTKATASTLCQKCLKRGHYSYECKATAQERPYLARPSRTQQLLNPKLRPQLTTDVPEDTLRTKGTADALLAQREAERGRRHDLDEIDSLDNRSQAAKRARSLSSASASSVSTISTNRSRSISPRQERYEKTRGESKARSQTSHHSWSRKRRYSDSSSGYSVSSYSSEERSRTRSPERNTRRRRRESSPKERGRPRDISRDGGRRGRCRSHSLDKGQATRGRRSLTHEETDPDRNFAKPFTSGSQPKASYHEQEGVERKITKPTPRQRSLSPYSKRIALTQAMNMGR
ncbi:zinc knuckle-domain-containing protein [Aspergillus navahoensis]